MPPRVYGSRWEILQSLGEGGQAHTFMVKDLATDQEGWVLKRLKNPNRLGRFQQEINALQQVNSPRIPRIEDYSINEPAYLVYPYVGKTLAEVVRQENPSFDEVFDYFRDVVEATASAHEVGIVHRDIKPDNVVIDDSRPKRRAYLIDFGICQFDDGGLFFTTVDEPLGNRSFAAPELELGSDAEPSQKSDVYALGKLLYWAVTGGQFLAREALSEAQINRIPQPSGVERAYIRRLLERTVRTAQGERASALDLLQLVEQYGIVMRLGVSAVGSRDQLCPVCRMGKLERTNDIRNLGFSVAGNLPSDTRFLHCGYCGYLQIHKITGTTSERERLWEI